MLLHLKNCVTVCLLVPAYTCDSDTEQAVNGYSEMLKTIHSPSSVDHPSHSSNSDRDFIPPSPFLSPMDLNKSVCVSRAGLREIQPFFA